MKFIGFLMLICCLMGTAMAQSNSAASQPPKPAPLTTGKNDTLKTYMTLDSGKLIPWIVTNDVVIMDTRIFKSREDQAKYYQLRYNVLKVLPYARFAGERYRMLQRDLALTANRHKQKQLINACQNQIKNLFNKEIKNLTISQGDILIKLIDRETGYTSYSMVQDLKGGFKAFVYQSVARVFGHNLKQTYDPDEDRDIESILIQAGDPPSYN